jgi:hypothetical protein
VVKYETTRKYPGLDETGEVKVLEAERAIILARGTLSVGPGYGYAESLIY